MMRDQDIKLLTDTVLPSFFEGEAVVTVTFRTPTQTPHFHVRPKDKPRPIHQLWRTDNLPYFHMRLVNATPVGILFSIVARKSHDPTPSGGVVTFYFEPTEQPPAEFTNSGISSWERLSTDDL